MKVHCPIIEIQNIKPIAKRLYVSIYHFFQDKHWNVKQHHIRHFPCHANRTALPGFYSLELNANLFSKESLTMADSKSLRILSVSDAKLANKSNLQEKFLSQWIYPFSQYPTHPNFQQP